MSWKKIDDAAVGADEPLDTYVLQGMQSNMNAALVDRPSSVGFAWPDGERPILYAATTVAVLLGKWTVTPRFDAVEVRLHHTVTNANVNFALTQLTQGGPLTTDLTWTAVAPGAQKTTLELTNLRQFWGETITLLLLVYSDTGDHAAGSPSVTPVTCRPAGGVTTAAGHGIVLSTANRYTLQIQPDPAGAGAEDNEGFPYPPTVQQWRAPVTGELILYIWPWLPREEAQWTIASSVTLSVLELGQSELYGYSIRESEPVEYPPITASIRPGRSPSAPRIGSLYGNNKLTFENQARILHCGPVWDPESVDAAGAQRCLWGPMVEHDAVSYSAIGSTLVGNYDKSVQDPSGAATDQIRSTLIVEGYIMALYGGQRFNLDLTIDLQVKLMSFAAGAWSASMVSASVTDIPIRARTRTFLPWDDLTAQIWAFGEQGNYMMHNPFRWALPLEDLAQPDQAGLVPFRIEITDTQVAAADRILLLMIKGNTHEGGGRPVRTAADYIPYYCCPSFTVRVKPGLDV